jgi:L,D-peptidoglycan transpeptidase YkuD (ErfK/YbiS/YcfS/YnhG family)
MWREDDVYDLVCILAHNDDPPVSPLGSAIFLHLARPGYTPTEGCVALSREDMLELLSLAKLGDAVAIEAV